MEKVFSDSGTPFGGGGTVKQVGQAPAELLACQLTSATASNPIANCKN